MAACTVANVKAGAVDSYSYNQIFNDMTLRKCGGKKRKTHTTAHRWPRTFLTVQMSLHALNH